MNLPNKLTVGRMIAVPFFIAAYMLGYYVIACIIFIAASFTFLRSPYYALAYAANDIILIVLWLLMSVKDIDNLPMIFCFVMFLFNDLYGFINWCRMEKRQKEKA